VGVSPKRDSRKSPFHDPTDEEWNCVMAVTVSAPFFVVREAYRYMPTDGSASIASYITGTSLDINGGRLTC
jgi:NAD(P)-dependent dehydrogenase (short-subunit alcohol dehydrogenase family)